MEPNESVRLSEQIMIDIDEENRVHATALDKLKKGLKYEVSTSIAGTVTYGYGNLDTDGFFEFPLYWEDVEAYKRSHKQNA